MKSLKYSLLITCLFIFSGTISSQDVVMDLDQVYGLDQTLYNGKKYDYLSPSGTSGHQFFSSTLFTTGSIIIKGKSYDDIAMNYDLFNQQLLIQYANENNPWNVLEVSKAWLNGFRIGKMNFELFQLENGPCFYQVLGDGPTRLLYFWRKTLNLNDAIGSNNYIYSPAIRDTYIFIDGQLKPFTSKRSLIRLFDQKKRAAIKSYLRKNKVKVKKSSDQTMAEMVNYIGKLK